MEVLRDQGHENFIWQQSNNQAFALLSASLCLDLLNFVCWQLNEVKRKIALVEGKRRALQSSFELQNKENRAALTSLGEEVQVQSKKVVLVNDKRRKGCKNIPRLQGSSL